jgi:predicted RNase H-like nuclease
MTPPRAVLKATSFEEANKVAPTLLDGKKISQQAWALRTTIFDVETAADQDQRIIEVHPEVSFRAMVGHPITFSKHSWNGTTTRRRALADQGLVIPDVLDHGGDVPAGDVLDALAAAWTARRFAVGKASALPAGAERSQRSVIWY